MSKFISIFFLLSLSSFASISINMNLDVKNESISKVIQTNFDKEETIIIPNSKKIIKLIASREIPNNLPLEYTENGIHIKLRVFEGSKLISSPEVVSLYGKDAFFSMQENPGERPSISLKLNTTRKK